MPLLRRTRATAATPCVVGLVLIGGFATCFGPAAVADDSSGEARVAAESVLGLDTPRKRERAFADWRTAPPRASIALPVVRDAIDFDDETTRVAAVRALAPYGAREDALALLAKALEDPSVRVRRASLWTLGDLGADALPAMPAVFANLRESPYYWQRLTEQTLTRIGEGGARIALEDPDPLVSLIGARALHGLGFGAYLPVALGSDDASKRLRSIEALWEDGRISSGDVAPLLRCFREQDADHSVLALRCVLRLVWQLGDDDAGVRAANATRAAILCEALESNDLGPQRVALRSLAALPVRDASVLRRVRLLRRSRTFGIRALSSRALTVLLDEKGAPSTARSGLDGPYPHPRVSSAHALGRGARARRSRKSDAR